MINSTVDTPNKLASDAPKIDTPPVQPAAQPKPAPVPEKAPAPEKAAK